MKHSCADIGDNPCGPSLLVMTDKQAVSFLTGGEICRSKKPLSQGERQELVFVGKHYGEHPVGDCRIRCVWRMCP
jgi:hypothetical protein